jgi:hypothetical protein
MTFQGTLDELKVLIESLGCSGHWEHKGQFELFVCDWAETNLRLNWWPESGTLTVVGDPAEREVLQESLQRHLAAQ